jgi:hypothetical protein
MPMFGMEESLEAARSLAGAGDWVVTSARPDGETLVLRLSVAGDERTFGIVLPAPWSDSPQWWLYDRPTDVQYWALMLKHWIEEEIDTGAAHGWAVIDVRDGVHYFAIEPYGFRRRDEAEHRRLSALAPQGWYAENNHGALVTPPDEFAGRAATGHQSPFEPGSTDQRLDEDSRHVPLSPGWIAMTFIYSIYAVGLAIGFLLLAYPDDRVRVTAAVVIALGLAVTARQVVVDVRRRKATREALRRLVLKLEASGELRGDSTAE